MLSHCLTKVVRALFNFGILTVILGALQIKLQSHQVLGLSKSHHGIRDNDPTSISFDDSGRILLSLNYEVLPILDPSLIQRDNLIYTNSRQRNLELRLVNNE